MDNYYYISPKLVKLGKRWDNDRPFYWPIVSTPDCFYRLLLWG